MNLLMISIENKYFLFLNSFATLLNYNKFTIIQ